MAAIENLLRRLGFVKLGRYGLTLTDGDRIASTRPTILDNGAGLRIVGWRDDDLAMTELSPWYPDILSAHRPAQRHVQIPVTPPLPPAAPAASRITAQRPALQPVAPPPSTEARVAAPAASAAMPVAVAPRPAVEEDDWEWTIALARARFEDEPTALRLPVQPMLASPPAPMPVQPTPAARSHSGQTSELFAMSPPATVAKPWTASEEPVPSIRARSTNSRARPAPVTPAHSTNGRPLPAPFTPAHSTTSSPVAAPSLAAHSMTSSPVAAPSAAAHSMTSSPVAAYAMAAHSVTSSRVHAQPLAPLPASSAPAHSTVIPVPRLPSIRDAEHSGRFEPVVRTTVGPAPAPPPGRLAKGTAPIAPDTEQRPAVSDAHLTRSVGDRTTPETALPLAARPVTLPSIKARMLRG